MQRPTPPVSNQRSRRAQAALVVAALMLISQPATASDAADLNTQPVAAAESVRDAVDQGEPSTTRTRRTFVDPRALVGIDDPARQGALTLPHDRRQVLFQLGCFTEAETAELFAAGVARNPTHVTREAYLASAALVFATILIGVVGLRRRGLSEWLGASGVQNRAGPLDLLAIAGLLAFAIVRLTRPVRHAFETFTFSHADGEIYASLFWNAVNGHGLFSAYLGMDFLGGHASPTLHLLVPIYALFPSAATPPLMGAVLLASAVVPAFLLARLRLGSALSLAVAAATLLHPSMYSLAGELHEVKPALPLLLWALFFMETRRPIAFVAALVLALGCKEEVSTVALAIGVLLLLRPGARWAGLFTVTLACTWFVVATQVILPWHLGGLDSTMANYAQFGGTLSGLASAPFEQPRLFWGTLSSGESLGYAKNLLLPFGFLPLLSPSALLLAAPTLAQNMLTETPFMRSMLYQYDTLAMPGLIYGLGVGLGRVPTSWLRVAVAVACAFALANTMDRFGRVDGWVRPPPDGHVEAIRDVMSHVPARVSLMAPDYIGPHFPERVELLRYDPHGYWPPVTPTAVVMPKGLRPTERLSPPEFALAHHELVYENDRYRLYVDPRRPAERCADRPPPE